MNNTNSEIKNLQEALNEKGFVGIANDINVLVNDPNVEITPSEDITLGEIEVPTNTYDQLYITESALGVEPHIDGIYEKEVLDDLRKLAEYEDKVAKHKEKIKDFIEANKLESFDGVYLKFKYTSATTSTSIDTARLKKECPDIAAEYSKTSARASSLSIQELK